MKEEKNILPTFIHWFSWTISLVASAVFAYTFLFEQVGDMMGGDTQLIFFVPCLIIAIAGCIWSLFKMKTGGIAMLAGGVGMVIVIAIQDGLSDFGLMVIYGVVYILPGLFFFLSGKARSI